MQHIYFYFDDSGVFHRNNTSGYFVYAGYVFLSHQQMEDARHKYIHANKVLREATQKEGELKAAVLTSTGKRSLFNSIRKYESLSLAVNLKKVYPSILDDKKARCRYKDYVLKRAIKVELLELLSKDLIKSDEDIHLHIFIDEQVTGTDGYYDLRDSIREELQHGIQNWDYGTIYPPVFICPVYVDISYCDSAHNYLIQAADILANRVWNSYHPGKEKMREISSHLHLTFP